MSKKNIGSRTELKESYHEDVHKAIEGLITFVTTSSEGEAMTEIELANCITWVLDVDKVNKKFMERGLKNGDWLLFASAVSVQAAVHESLMNLMSHVGRAWTFDRLKADAAKDGVDLETVRGTNTYNVVTYSELASKVEAWGELYMDMLEQRMEDRNWTEDWIEFAGEEHGPVFEDDTPEPSVGVKVLTGDEAVQALADLFGPDSPFSTPPAGGDVFPPDAEAESAPTE